MCRFLKIRGTILGVPIKRTIIYWVYIGVPLFMETTMLALRDKLVVDYLPI